MTSQQERSSIFAILVGGAGTLLAALMLAADHFLGFYASSQMLSKPLAKALSAILKSGVFALAPTLLMSIALVVLKLRHRWFFFSTCSFAALCLPVVPVGTASGLVLMILAGRKLREFYPAPPDFD